MAQLNFDATNVPHDIGFDPVPAGWYKAVMDESEMKPTKAGDGAYLNCRFTIIDGPYMGRKLFTRLNLRNANAVAQEIGFKQLSAIAHAVGVLQVADSSQLHGIPLQLKVKLRKGDGEYEDNNEVTSYKNVNEVVGSSAVAAAPAAYPQPGAYPPPPAAAPAGWGAPPPVAPAQQWGAPPAPQAAPQQPPQGAWAPPAAAQPWAAAPAAPEAGPGPAPGPWTPPNGGQAWQAQPPQQGAAPAAAPTPPQPAHPAQGAVPPWQQPRS